MRNTTRVLATALVLLAASIACQAVAPEEPGAAAPTAPDAAIATEASAPTSEAPTSAPEPAPTEDPCVKPEEVTTDMKGEVVCMRGIIAKFDQSRQVGTRYSFSDLSRSFFLYSAKYEITDPNTGKTVAPGTCVEVTGTIDVQSDTPYINLDKLIENAGDPLQTFLFYDDPAACE